MSVKVLIVDDQSLVRAGFRMILDAEPDIEVVGEAADGLEAVLAARQTEPDVILMDVRMPNVDGLEATRRLLDGRDEGPRILILTTFDLDEYVYEALRAGASGFMLKDTPPEELVEAIMIVARGDALLAPSITRRVIEEFVRRPPASARKAPPELEELTAREREMLRFIARGPLERRDREGGLRQRDDGEDPRRAHPDEAAAARPRAGCRLRLRERGRAAGRRLTGCGRLRCTSAASLPIPRAMDAQQRQLEAYPDGARPGLAAEADARRPIGEIFVELGFISRAELQSALEVQRTTGGRIGEILVDQGSLTRIDLASALAEHWEPHAYDRRTRASRARSTARCDRRPSRLRGSPRPERASKPRRSRLRRSATREDALRQISRMSERLVANARDPLRADHDRAVAERFQALALRLDRGREPRRRDRPARSAARCRLGARRPSFAASSALSRSRSPPPTRVSASSSSRSASTAQPRDSHDRIAALAAELRTEVAISARTTGSGTARRVGSLAGRLDELFGLRHADAQAGTGGEPSVCGGAAGGSRRASQADDDRSTGLRPRSAS